MSRAAQVTCPHCQTRAVPVLRHIGGRIVKQCRGCGARLKKERQSR